jgi:Zn-dependent protease
VAFGPEVLLSRVMLLIPLLMSLTVHEFFHAWTAWRLGDDTAARMGRLTLNPVAHIDPFGTLLLPLLGVPFGWAKPVPVQPSRFRKGISMSAGDILVSAAGPLSNLGLAVACTLVFVALHRFLPSAIAPGTGVDRLLDNLVLVNVALAVFNFLPIPPLDGGHVAANLVPYRWRGAWDRFAAIAPFVLLGIVFFGRGIMSVPIEIGYDLLTRLAAALT